MPDYDIAAALGATDVFAPLHRRTLASLARIARVVPHSAGQPVTDEGQDGVGFHVILEGTAAVSVGGRKRPSLGPGDYFGEISLIDGLPRSASVTAETDLVTASLASWNVVPLVNEQVEVARVLLLTLCRRLRAAESAGTGAG